MRLLMNSPNTGGSGSCLFRPWKGTQAVAARRAMWVLVMMACLACLAGAAGPGLAQEVSLDPSDYHICNALPDARGMDVCVEYYKRKEAIMGDVLKTFYTSMFYDPGNQGVERTVLLRVLDWQDELDMLYDALAGELPETWPDELHNAYHKEVEDTDIAARFWANECHVATMVNQELCMLEDADQDYVEKINELRLLAYGMAEAYQDAQRELAGSLDREQRDRLCREFAPNVAKAVAVTFVLDQMYDQLVDTFMGTLEEGDKYLDMFDEDTEKYLVQLPEEWVLDEQAEVHMMEMFDDHSKAAQVLKKYVDELNSDTIFDNLGEPFDRIDYADLPEEYTRALNAICQ